ncbi:MAG: type III polyketide synthase [Phycisphaerales bacterium]
MGAWISGLGLATPPCTIGQVRAAELAAEVAGYDPVTARFARAIYAGSGVTRRAGVVLAERDGVIDSPMLRGATGGGPGTAARMGVYQSEAGGLACAAARAALADASVAGDAVTHLVTASCTGFGAPGVDLALMDSLGLPASTQRTNVGFMGCHAAVNALRVARAFAVVDPGAVVLVCCVELCSLHFQNESRADAVVANALFADGAGAVVVTGGARACGLELRSTASALIPGSSDAMSWSVGDHGFVMSLSPAVPALVEAHVAPWMTSWLGREGLAPADIAGWAVHPGGPKVLDATERALRLNATDMAASREVLAQHGNMSSPTVLFVLDRLRRAARMPAVMLAFGPGLHAEAALVG